MKTNDFNLRITSSRLAENLEKQFGSRVNLSNYNREQLEDIRNKLRTRIFQQEGKSGINDLLTNETYQKDKAMLELLNTRIKEMLGEQMQKLRDKMDALNEGKKGTRPPKTKITAKGSKKPDDDSDGVPDWADKKPGKDDNEGKKKGAAPKKGVNPFAKKTDNVKEAQGDDAKERAAEKQADRDDPMSPSYKDKKEKSSGVTRVKGKSYGNQADTDKDLDEGKSCSKGHTKMTKGCKECAGMYEALKGGQKKLDVNHNNKLEKDDFAALRAKKKVKESMFKHNVRFVNESLEFLLQEDEEGKAKAITAAGDMVNDFTSWMQRVGQYQTKSMIELADAIKADFGPTEAEAFKAAVAPALSATLEVLTQQREAISGAVAVLAGEAAPEAPMGMEPSMSPEPGMDMSAPDEMNPEPMGDEFGAADAAAGGAETSGRAMRESKFARRLAESHSIMSKLAK